MINVVGLATMLAKHGFGAKDQQDYQVLVQSVCDACKDSDSVNIMSALHLLMDDDKIHDAIRCLCDNLCRHPVERRAPQREKLLTLR